MKILHISIISILVLCSNGVVYAQYGLYGQEALDHQSLLQKELDLARTQIEKHQQDEQQTKNITDTIIFSSVGIPLAVGISVCVLLFARKRK